MSNAARKARKRAGVKFERKEKVPTGYLGRPSYGLPFIDHETLNLALALGRSVWESRSFRAAGGVK